MPTAPHEVGLFNTVDYAQDVYVSGDYAYVADSFAGLRIIEISTPTVPQEVAYINCYAKDVFVSGGGSNFRLLSVL